MYGNMDDFLPARMILCGISLDDPYLQSQLLVMMREELKSLKAGRIPVSDSYNLMGTADPTGTLGPDEVCIILYVLSSEICLKYLEIARTSTYYKFLYLLLYQ